MKNHIHYFIGLSAISILIGCNAEDASRATGNSQTTSSHIEKTNSTKNSIPSTSKTITVPIDKNQDNSEYSKEYTTDEASHHEEEDSTSPSTENNSKKPQQVINNASNEESPSSIPSDTDQVTQEMRSSSSCKVYNPITGGCED